LKNISFKYLDILAERKKKNQGRNDLALRSLNGGKREERLDE
jgi:hypothetical protein